MPVFNLGRLMRTTTLLCGLLLALCASHARAEEATAEASTAAVPGVDTSAAAQAEEPDSRYLIQPGDQLAISVWGETDLTLPVVVRPDGRLSYPLVGDVSAVGRTAALLASQIQAGLKAFLPDPLVNVSVVRADGNLVYVIGKVNRPGAFPMNRRTDVIQALTLAGGLDPFADADEIQILRHGAESTESFRFDFTAVARGRSLQQNIALQPGDVVVVP